MIRRKLEPGFPENDSIYEAIYGDFVEILRQCYRRDPENYSFISVHYDDEVAKNMEDYLKENHIPFSFRAYDRISKKELPPRNSCVIEDTRVRRLMSYGIFHIYPDTDREIFYYYYGPFDRIGRRVAFVAFRDIDSFNELISEIKAFVADRIRNNRVMLYDGEVQPLEEIHWDDVILPDELYRGIRISIESFLKGKEIYKKINIPYKRGILLAGQPGNGKTMLCKAIAWECGLPFIVCSLHRSLSDFEIDETFDKARELSPAIVCFEDIDSLRRTSVTLSYFLNKLDGFDSVEGVLIVATTNKPEEIDVALSNRPSRFDSVFRIPNPDKDCRYRMLKRYFKDTVSEEIIKELVSKTKGFTMAYLKELYLLSVMSAINRETEIPDEADINSALETLKRQMASAQKPVEEKRQVGFDIDDIFDRF